MRSLISLDRHIIHRETFQGGDQGVRLNPYHRSVPTAMAYGNAGGRIGSYGIFNGTTSKIDCGSDFIGTGACSISAWIYADSYGESSVGVVITNNQLVIRMATTNNRIVVSSNGESNYFVTDDNAFPINQWNHLVFTRTGASGIIYVNGVNVKSGNSGTPVAGATNAIIGNNNAQSRTFDGFINLEVYDLVLTADEAWALYNGRLYR